MSDTPQLPSKRFKSEDVAASPTSAHMSHGQNYVTPSHFPHAYTSAYSNPQPPQSQHFYGQQTYVNQPLSLVQPDHHYQNLSHPLSSYHASQLPSAPSRKRPASELDAPHMGVSTGMPSMSSYSMQTGSGLLGGSGHGGSTHSNVAGGGLGLSQSTDPGMHLGSVQEITNTGTGGPRRGRTNTPWTREEEMRLKAMRDHNNSWSEIAREFPNRTEGSVKKHWYKDMHYTEISEDEGSFKAALVAAIKEYDANKWKIIGQKMGKPAKACEQFAREHLGKS